MAKNKIQLQKGLSLPELLARFGSEEQCRQELFHLRWPQGYQCPNCGHDQYCEIRGRKLYQCKNCRFQASVTRGTIFAATKLPFHLWLMGIYLTTQSKDGISSQAALRMKHKLQQVMKNQDDRHVLGGLLHGRPQPGRQERPGSLVVSDGLSGFPGVADAECQHESIIMSLDAEYDPSKRFSWLNTVIGNVKNALRGTVTP